MDGLRAELAAEQTARSDAQAALDALVRQQQPAALLAEIQQMAAALAAERTARADAQAALEALTRQQAPAVPTRASSVPTQASSALHNHWLIDGAGEPHELEQAANQPSGRGQSPDAALQRLMPAAAAASDFAAEAAALRRRLQQAQHGNAAIKADLQHTQDANALLRASLEAETAAAAATQEADAAEIRQLSERLRHAEAARMEAVQVCGLIYKRPVHVFVDIVDIDVTVEQPLVQSTQLSAACASE